MNCRICHSETSVIFEGRMLRKYDVRYYHCDNCGFLFTEDPYWLKEAYEDSMNISDTGILLRNLSLSRFASVIIFFLFDRKAKFLDYAGGYGVFTRLMRDIGFDFYWYDPYTKNVLARGFEGAESGRYEIVTSFESFEHFVDPLVELERMLKISDNIFFSTTLLPSLVPRPDRWWYYGLEHGQHIAFYSERTLSYMAKKHGMNAYSFLNIHLITSKKIDVLIYKLLIGASILGLSEIVRRCMRSKTFSDMQDLIAKSP